MKQASPLGMTSIVVVADDEALIRMDVADVFQDEGYVVLEAEHASAALNHLRGYSHLVVALVTDIQMPGGMDGIALVHEARRCWPWIHLVVASGRVRPAAIELPQGCRFLAKPYPAKHAVRHVREMIETGA